MSVIDRNGEPITYIENNGDSHHICLNDVYVGKQNYRNLLELFLYHKLEDKEWQITGFIVEEVKENISPRGMTLRPDMAVKLMDELYNAGVRPSATGSYGQLESTKYHLEDMRRLVFKDVK